MTRYNLLAFSARAAIPTKYYGQPAQLPLQLNATTAHLRTTIPADIPDNAVSTTGELVFTVAQAWSGARTFNIRRHSAAFTSLITWNTRPNVVGTTYAVTVTSPAVGDTFSIDVNADIQAFIAGSATNYGWQMTTTSSSQSLLNGAKAAVGVPYLDLEWALPGEAPTDLSPDGRIATGNPTLTFQLPEGSTHIQIQVSTTDDFAATVYDSTMVDAPLGGVFELTGYTIPDGATRYWRIRAWSSGVPSEWSGAAEVIRDDLATLTITDPATPTGDPDPTVEWTFTGQAAWQAQLYDDALGRIVADSGRNAGTDQEWTPDQGLRGEGTGKFIVRTWDANADRVPTPNVPVYAQAVYPFTVAAAGTDDGPATLMVTQREGTPIIDLEWSFTVTPSKVQILRNGKFLKRVDGAVTEFADRTAGRFENITYAVRAVTAGGVVSTLGDAVLVYPRSAGIWLLDPDVDFDVDAAACLLGKDQGTQTMEEQAITHPVNNRAAVRRRIGIVPPAGEQAGPIMSALGLTADESYEQLMAWKTEDAGKVYRLVLGNQNFPVTVGDIQAFPTPDSADDHAYAGAFKWWQTDDELPWG